MARARRIHFFFFSSSPCELEILLRLCTRGPFRPYFFPSPRSPNKMGGPSLPSAVQHDAVQDGVFRKPSLFFPLAQCCGIERPVDQLANLSLPFFFSHEFGRARGEIGSSSGRRSPPLCFSFSPFSSFFSPSQQGKGSQWSCSTPRCSSLASCTTRKRGHESVDKLIENPPIIFFFFLLPFFSFPPSGVGGRTIFSSLPPPGCV